MKSGREYGSQSSASPDLEAQKGRVSTKLDEYARGAESACARAMAEAERLLGEISGVAPWTHFDLSLAKAVPGGLLLDPGLDFVVHDGKIELTKAGFRRMGQAHSAGLDTVIKIDRRDVFRFPATELGRASSDRNVY